MLTLKKLTWSNCFSYGEQNVMDLNKEPLTQLVGPNGAGKTSISLMLQEVLYGKNIKNIKKQDITNNKTSRKGYYIKLDFVKDNDEYTVELDRKTNLKFRLYKNEEDISSHTSLNTYKTLANIIGVTDFKIFCQLIYQHSTDSLDFLTATDTNRKKFLISLLQLDRYLELHELFKTKVRDLNSVITGLEGGISTIEAWINENENMSFIKQDLLNCIDVPKEWYVEERKLHEQITDINSINRKIILNKSYIAKLNLLDSKYYLGTAPAEPNPGINELRAQVRVIEHQYNIHQQKISKLSKVEGECPECLQVVNRKDWEDMLNAEISCRDKEKAKLASLWDKIPDTDNITAEILKYKKQKADFVELNRLIDNSIPTKTLDLNELKAKRIKIRAQISKAETLIKSTEIKNLKISAHNSKVDVVKAQLEKMRKDLLEKNIVLVENENLADIMELLKKTFGTNGLVSYKIESSVKELEKKINTYLAELTYFQIYFKLSGEKLNIEVLDDIGNITSISNLSSGERARVNIATILAIRNILSSLTSTKINLLFLDEVIGVIDAEGKEKLSEILLKEDLNTFIVSHDWSHPLIPRINIIKEHHISRIEND